MLGSAAVKGAQQLNTIPAAVLAADGPTETSAATPTPDAANTTASGAGGELGSRGFGSSGPGQRQRLGAELRTYLEKVFKDRPAALSRIREAYEKEQQQEGTQQGGAGGFGYRQPEPTDKQAPDAQQPAVEAMSLYINPPNTPQPGNPAIDALYEADHPEHQSRMQELVTQRGYPLETYTVVTPDGYELVMFRIPYGKYRNNQPGVKKPVVFLAHGVTLASDSFTILNANESMGFVLADAGFDVWFGNTRGNTYSRRNVNGLYTYMAEFWYFSFDQLSTIDLPTMIDFALAKAGASKLAFVGHSQGCTLAIALCADKPEYNNKFSVIAHMGPVVFVDFFRAPFLRFAAINSLDQLFIALSIGEFLPNRLVAPLYGTLCISWPLDEVCAAALSFIFYGPSIFITPDDYVSIATTWPSSVGSRNLVHWAQNFRSSELELRKYDFGTACNVTKWKFGHGFQPKPFRETCNQYEYGSEVPPAYDLTKVTAPTLMFLGENDIMSVASDVEEEVRRFGPAHRGDFIYSDYAHMDFVWDRNAKHLVDLADVFFRFSPGTF
ncbi:hypothetical protein OEZ85_007658 [Tetradesmus obliquus]|uniref:Partial AB-hydrolase lipase domain-containing protein n=1 Tax=Tetradesmus obliquus TaxID=3088 RepID=A0ABY8TH32_TETOB|nr:hypothetical protein OEZ85_007658 [Tetradesmus obliquus]